MPKQSKRYQFILASRSPRRRALLKQARYRFKVVPSRANERYPSGFTPAKIVTYLAAKKAKEVAKRFPNDIIVGADTLVFLKKRVIGKPRSVAHARRILRALSGEWQHVLTGVAVIKGKKIRTRYAATKVKIRPLTEKDIEHACRHHLDKAGAYAIQQKNDPFVERIVGEYDNVVGLPVRVVRKLLNLAR